MKDRETSNEKVIKCYKCLKRCNPSEIPYCITSALIKSANGDTVNSLVFCGAKTYMIDKITSVDELMEELWPQAD